MSGDPTSEQQWRGVAGEDVDAVDAATSLRLAARSRWLLGSLLRLHLRPVLAAVALLVADQVALLAGPWLIAGAIDSGIPAALDGRPAPLAWYVAGYAGAGLADAGILALFVRLSGRIGQDVLLDLRHRVFAHVQRLSLSFHERYTSGRVISRLTSDVDSLQDMLESGLDGFFTSVLSIVGIAVMLLVLDAPLGLVVLAGFVPLLLMARWYLRASQRAYRGTRTWVTRVIVHLVESMNGVRAVQAFRRERRNETILDGMNGAYADANRTTLVLIARFNAVVRLVGNVSIAAVLLYGGLRVTEGTLELGVLTAFVLYLRRFYDPLDRLAMFADSYSSAAAALEKISGVLEERPTVLEPARPVPLGAPRGEVVFDGVGFGYGSGPEVLSRLDLVVPAGQTVALVGATGAGKSTLAKLLARFYDPRRGAVRLDGVDLRSVVDAELRRAVVMVTQESFLFSGSVADNIALGRPGATREEIVGAARAVGGDEFVTALPEGYDTDVRKRGARLSAGQRQLVAFARALLADPAVLVLDEATSSLDIPSERAVQAALETVLADRTALIIAHRLSTVLIADRVLVLADGMVVEDGTPEDLIVGRGTFADLHTAWRRSLA
ncbi:MAG: ABC transporter ATP-binding protein [Pseudonocardiales bacterium]|nr:ABC transporter ATP-binding protein [Pseudonocardiales bacterium]